MAIPRVDFYITDPTAGERTRLNLVCRLVDKAYAAGQPTLVVADQPRELAALDELLWTNLDSSFIPHDLLPAAASGAEAEAPVLLASSIPAAVPRTLLINLCAEVPAAAIEFARVLEIPAAGPQGRQQGRERFRAWRQLGAEPTTHQLGGQPKAGRSL
ncbi:MAG: DNA polymerase III subunit chi [Steroidobacteraceae bacterium]|nr:DNA polymerase III subunit chi [Nevskiaceae bacterium]